MAWRRGLCLKWEIVGELEKYGSTVEDMGGRGGGGDGWTR